MPSETRRADRKSKSRARTDSTVQDSKARVHYKTRIFLVSFLITLGALMSAVYGIVYWTETQIFNADNWVTIVGPLPKDEQVAAAVSDYSVSKLFESVDVQQKITEVLPERAAFLAAPLTKQLQNQANNLAKNFVMSDQFQNVWESANRIANTRLINSARGQESQPLPVVQKAETKFNINLSGLKNTIIERLGQSNSGLFDQTSDKVKNNEILISLKTSYENFRRFVKTNDALYSILPFAIIAAFIGAIAIAIKRQKAVLWTGISIMIISTLQVVGINALRPQIINMVENQLYRPAAQAIWSALVNPFNAIVRTAFIAGLALLLIAIVFGPYAWAKALRQKLRLTEIPKARVFDYVRLARSWTEKNKKYIWGGGGAILLIFLTFYSDISWAVAIESILLATIYVAVVELFATRSYLLKG